MEYDGHVQRQIGDEDRRQSRLGQSPPQTPVARRRQPLAQTARRPERVRAPRTEGRGRYVSSGPINFQRGARARSLAEWVERGGWRAVALLRLIPIMHHSLANYGLGLTGVPLGAYAFGSLIGQSPLTIAYVELGAAGERLLTGGTGWIEPTLIGFTALSLSLLFSAYFRRRSR